VTHLVSVMYYSSTDPIPDPTTYAVLRGRLRTGSDGALSGEEDCIIQENNRSVVHESTRAR